MCFDRLPPFVPHGLIRGPHLQTFLGYHLRCRVPRYAARRCEVVLADGGRLWVHDDRPAAWAPGDRAVLLAPGMGGTCYSPYMARIAVRLNEAGHRTFRMDQRGCGDSACLAAPAPAHAGRSEDVVAALHTVMSLCPGSPIAVVGFSMGGNMVLKALGETGDAWSPPVDRCLAVAPPIDMSRCVRTSHPKYSKWLARSLWMQERSRTCPVRLARPDSVWEFDALVTARECGFADVEDYYQRSSARHVLRHIRIPTWILAAADDPVIHPGIFADAALSPQTRLLLTPAGGHVGYLSNARHDRDFRWLDWRIVDWTSQPA